MTLKGERQLQARFRALRDSERILRRVQIEAVREAKLLVPRRTGNLGRTIRPGEVSDRQVSIVAGGQRDVGYAAAVEFGTGPRVIRPRKRKVLAWGGERTLGGRLRKGAKATTFARRVNHPGTRARPYLGPGMLRAAKNHMGESVVGVWNKGA